MATESDAWTWNDVVAVLREQPIGMKVEVPATAIAEPAGPGWHSLPTGADGCPAFGGELDAQHGIIVRALGANYEASLCRLPQTQQAPSPPTVVPPAAPRRAAPQTQVAVPVRVESRTELVVEAQRERSLANVIADSPGETLLLTTAIGTAIGALLGGARGALAGAVAGGGAGLASVALSTAATSPVTAQISATMFLALAANALGGRGSGPVLRLGPGSRPALPPHIEEDEPPRRPRRPRKR